MLFIVGLDSVYAWVTTMVAYVDDFREARGMTKKPMWQTSGICIGVLYFFGLLFTTRMGEQLLSIVDHFVGSIFLLLVVSLEAIMFNVDFGWDRMNFALKRATYGNPQTPQGRSLLPSWLCRLDFHATAPAISGLLGIYMIINDVHEVYNGYPPGLVLWGWFLLVGLIVVACSTLWRREESALPPYSMAEIMQEETKVSVDDFDSGIFIAPEISVNDRTSLSLMV
jgi:hypothetical protein